MNCVPAESGLIRYEKRYSRERPRSTNASWGCTREPVTARQPGTYTLEQLMVLLLALALLLRHVLRVLVEIEREGRIEQTSEDLVQLWHVGLGQQLQREVDDLEEAFVDRGLGVARYVTREREREGDILRDTES